MLTPAFLQTLLPQAEVRAVRPCPLDSSASILSNLTAAGQPGAAPIGLFGLEAELRTAGGPWRRQRLVLKAKPPAQAICQMVAGLAQACGGKLAEVYPAFADRTGFAHTHQRELDVYAAAPPPNEAPALLLPHVWATHADEARGQYLVLLEDLSQHELLNSALRPDAWTDAHLTAALRQLAAWHAQHLEPARDVSAERPVGPAPWPELLPLWEALLGHAARVLPVHYTPARVAHLRGQLSAAAADWTTVQRLPHTLIHNDLNPRNTCFERRPGGGRLRLVAYDWELATRHLPAYDAVELLSFVLRPARYARRAYYLELYRQALAEYSGSYADRAEFAESVRLAQLEFGLHRLGLYVMAHSLRPYPFLPATLESYFAGLGL